MRLLLDTHTLVWAALFPDRLSERAREAITDPDNYAAVSAITAMEIATKVRLGRFDDARPLAAQFADQVSRRGFEILSVTADHGERAGNLIDTLKDPWDRLLVAQALIENLTLVTADAELRAIGTMTLW